MSRNAEAGHPVKPAVPMAGDQRRGSARHLRLVGLLRTFAFVGLGIVGAHQVQDTIAATPYPVVEFRGGLLSVRVRNSLWEAVLKEIERQTGISMRLVGLPAGTLTHEFEAVPLEKGLRRLFCDANLVFFYANSSGKEPSDGGPNSSRNTFLDSNAAGNDGDDANLQMPSFGNTFVANHFNNPEGLEQACINLPN